MRLLVPASPHGFLSHAAHSKLDTAEGNGAGWLRFIQIYPGAESHRRGMDPTQTGKEHGRDRLWEDDGRPSRQSDPPRLRGQGRAVPVCMHTWSSALRPALRGLPSALESFHPDGLHLLVLEPRPLKRCQLRAQRQGPWGGRKSRPSAAEGPEEVQTTSGLSPPALAVT